MQKSCCKCCGLAVRIFLDRINLNTAGTLNLDSLVNNEEIFSRCSFVCQILRKQSEIKNALRKLGRNCVISVCCVFYLSMFTIFSLFLDFLQNHSGHFPFFITVILWGNAS